MKLRLDEMVPVRVARELRRAGFDVDAVGTRIFAACPTENSLRGRRPMAAPS